MLYCMHKIYICYFTSAAFSTQDTYASNLRVRESVEGVSWAQVEPPKATGGWRAGGWRRQCQFPRARAYHRPAHTVALSPPHDYCLLPRLCNGESHAIQDPLHLGQSHFLSIQFVTLTCF